jgi:hypothetical protein
MNTAYDKWVASRRFVLDLSEEVDFFEDGQPSGYIFDADGSFIQFMEVTGQYWTISTNEDAIMDTLEAAQKWLWNNWARYNVEEPECTIDPQLG